MSPAQVRALFVGAKRSGEFMQEFRVADSLTKGLQSGNLRFHAELVDESTVDGNDRRNPDYEERRCYNEVVLCAEIDQSDCASNFVADERDGQNSDEYGRNCHDDFAGDTSRTKIAPTLVQEERILVVLDCVIQQVYALHQVRSGEFRIALGKGNLQLRVGDLLIGLRPLNLHLRNIRAVLTIADQQFREELLQHLFHNVSPSVKK